MCVFNFKRYAIEALYTYFDTDSQWKRAYNNSLVCHFFIISQGFLGIGIGVDYLLTFYS